MLSIGAVGPEPCEKLPIKLADPAAQGLDVLVIADVQRGDGVQLDSQALI